MQSTTIAVDLAKSVFEVAISHRPGVVVERKRLSRRQFAIFLANHEPADVVMEACGTAHFWGRKAQEIGHRVRLLPPKYVRPYIQGNKTDRADTKGILEADRNEDIVSVPVKSLEQQALTALHRMRSAWVSTRTSRINTLRGVLREFGLLIPVGARKVAPEVWLLLGDAESGVPDMMRPVLAEAVREISWLDERIKEVEKQLHGIAKSSPDIQRLLTIPGIGLLTATALVAMIGNVNRFPSARHLASFLGLTPREKSSGYTRYVDNGYGIVFRPGRFARAAATSTPTMRRSTPSRRTRATGIRPARCRSFSINSDSAETPESRGEKSLASDIGACQAGRRSSI